jgi:hypothetical protein
LKNKNNTLGRIPRGICLLWKGDIKTSEHLGIAAERYCDLDLDRAVRGGKGRGLGLPTGPLETLPLPRKAGRRGVVKLPLITPAQ